MKAQILALAGGVGGAKLSLGLSKLLTGEQLTIVVNTGDDENFYGLHVSPDLDTMIYTLAEVVNPKTGWGIKNDTFSLLNQLNKYHEQTWFNLGDKDLATHIHRTNLIESGHSLTEISLKLCQDFGVRHKIVPMTDHRVRTILETNVGTLRFQEYFVEHKCNPKVSSIRFDGADIAMPSNLFVESLTLSNALIYCPSNPYLSIDPILAVSGVEEMIRNFKGPRIAISPIVGDSALRGPAAKMMVEFGMEPSCVNVAKKFRGICDIFVIDESDKHHVDTIRSLGFQVETFNTIMLSNKDKIDLARRILKVVELY